MRMKSKAKGIPWIPETLLVRSLLGDLDQCIHLNYKINLVLMILRLHKHLGEESQSGLHMGDLLEDAKFYQDMAIELQTAYQTLERRFTQQACLMEEASGALHAAESQASKRQQELLKLQKDCESDIQLAVGEAVYEYREQLAAAKQKQQSKDHKQQQMVHQLQDQVRALELTLASHATLPSVRPTKEEADL